MNTFRFLLLVALVIGSIQVSVKLAGQVEAAQAKQAEQLKQAVGE